MKAAGLPLPFSSPQQRESTMNRVQFTLSFPQKNPRGPARGRREGREGEGEKRNELREKRTKDTGEKGESR